LSNRTKKNLAPREFVRTVYSHAKTRSTSGRSMRITTTNTVIIFIEVRARA
jgi:hypothetical protein